RAVLPQPADQIQLRPTPPYVHVHSLYSSLRETDVDQLSPHMNPQREGFGPPAVSHRAAGCRDHRRHSTTHDPNERSFAWLNDVYVGRSCLRRAVALFEPIERASSDSLCPRRPKAISLYRGARIPRYVALAGTNFRAACQSASANRFVCA